jgi:leucine dehydrogenase
MERDLASLIRNWDGLGVVSRFDAPTDTWIFVALHDDTLGAPVGGTRIKIYRRPEDGLLDAQRLSAGMTHKWAAIELPFGGGKAVLAQSRELDPDERAGLLDRFADLLNSLNGTFATGQDLGTTPEDIRRLALRSPHVHGFDRETGTLRDPGPYTAWGVFCGMRAAVRAAFGEADLAGRVILLEGYGGVGRPLARHCHEAGARLLIADLDEGLARKAAEAFGGSTVPLDRVAETACDVYAPCAVGATLGPETIPRLHCRVVAGSANNQLAGPGDAEALHRRRVLYAPDFVINGGGALGFGLRSLGETDEATLFERIGRLGESLDEIFREAAAADESPLRAAERRVRTVLERRRERRAAVRGDRRQDLS